jgi:hypothetical protein
MKKDLTSEAILILDRFRDTLSRFEAGELLELDVVSYVERLAEIVGEILLRSLEEEDKKALFEVIKFASSVDEGEVTSIIFNMITLQLNALLTVLASPEREDLMDEELMNKLRNEDFVNFSADATIKALESGNLEEAIDISISYLMLGFYSAIVGDEVCLDNAIDYFIFTGLKLVDEADALVILFKTHIYLSYLIITEVSEKDDELLKHLYKYRDKKMMRTFIARTFYNLISKKRVFDKIKIEMEVNDRLARLIRKSLQTKSDWGLLREMRSLNWLYRKYSKYYSNILDNSLYALEGALRAFSKNPEDINISEDVLEKGVQYEDEDRTIIALFSTALKMYKMGLKDAYKNVINGMRRLSRQKNNPALHRLVEILERIDEDSRYLGPT